MRTTWETARDLGNLLSMSARVAPHKDSLIEARTSFNPGAASPTWRSTLARMSAMNNNRYMAQPMRFITQAQYDPFFSTLATDPDARDFLLNAQAIYAGAALTVDWLRSRLAGYPDLGVPQLAPGSTRIEPSLDDGWTWIGDFRPMSLETKPAPAEIAVVFQLAATDLTNALNRVGEAIVDEAPVRAFGAAQKNLDDGTRRELAELCQSFSSNATNPAVDAISQSRLLRRDRHRLALLRSAIDHCSPPARAYCQAFDAADDLIDDVMNVVSYVAFWGPPVAPREVRRIRRINRRWTQIDCRDFRFALAPLGLIVEAPPCPGLSDPILLLGVSMTGVEEAVLFGRLLTGGQNVFGPPIQQDMIPWVQRSTS